MRVAGLFNFASRRGRVAMVLANDKAELWSFIVSCGLEEEFKRDLMGRVKHKRTRLVLRADVTPELVLAVAGASDLVASARRGAAGAMAAARRSLVERLLANAEKQ